MKYLYILTSSDSDLYYEQIYLSITSLLLYNSDANITLITDNHTYESLYGSRRKILELVKDCKVIPFSADLSPKVRSRLLKTNMRNLVDGDFLYLDCDTIVLSALEIPEDWSFSIGAIKNLHFNNVKESPIFPVFRFFADECGINITSEDYFNSGVLFVKDNLGSRIFFKHWHELYLKYLEENSVDVDQLSLYKTNNDFGGFIKEVSGEWNWQVGFGLNYMCNAKIMHTFSSVNHQLHNIHFLKRKDFYEDLKHGLYTDSEIIQIIKNAKSLFDEKLRIIPIDNVSDTVEKSLIEFCAKNMRNYFYGDEEIFLQVQGILNKNGIDLNGFICNEKGVKNSGFIEIPAWAIKDFSVSQQDNDGIIVGVDIYQINTALSELFTHNLKNIHIYI